MLLEISYNQYNVIIEFKISGSGFWRIQTFSILLIENSKCHASTMKEIKVSG